MEKIKYTPVGTAYSIQIDDGPVVQVHQKYRDAEGVCETLVVSCIRWTKDDVWTVDLDHPAFPFTYELGGFLKELADKTLVLVTE